MKRTLAAFLATTLLILTLASCGDGELKDNETAESSDINKETTGKSPAETEVEKVDYSAIIAQNTKRAEEIASSTLSKYMYTNKYETDEKQVYLAEKYKVAKNRKVGTASVWHYTSALAMTSRLSLIASNPDYYSSLYGDMYHSLAYYSGKAKTTTYIKSEPITLYAVNRANEPGKADVTGVMAVYDDQMWMIREFINVYQNTGDETYLDEALRLTQICLDGWDFSLDANGNEYGGIPWGPGYSSKHTCSNAPMISPLVKLYEIYSATDVEKAQYYLDWAKKIYNFCAVFENSNHLYGDLIGSERKIVTEDGVKHYQTTSQGPGIDHSEYTYNTGTMIGGGAALYRVTGDTEYLDAAVQSASAAYKLFSARKIIEGYALYPTTSTMWFNLILLEGFIELYPHDTENCTKYIESFQKSVDYAYENYNNDGLLPRDYLRGWDESNDKDAEKDIMDQTAAAEIYALLTLHYSTLMQD